MRREKGRRYCFGTIILIIVMISCLFRSPTLWAEDTNDTEGEEKTNALFFYPIFYYTPETKLAGGGTVNYVFRPGGNRVQSRPSSIVPIFIYTQKSQIISAISLDFYLKNDVYHLYSYMSYTKYPDYFYGIGHDTSKEAEESYTDHSPSLRLSFKRRLFKGFYLGVQYDFAEYKLTDLLDDGILATGDIVGSNGGRVSGASLLINYDTRNNLFSPSWGGFYLFSAGFFHKSLGSDFGFNQYHFDIRRYLPVFGAHVIAFQGYLHMTTGNPPFQMLAKLGGQNMMRGYYLGRYRDRNMAVCQIEYRMPVWRAFGIVIFGGVGNVAHRMRDFSLNNLKYSIGGGIRYMVNPVEKINLRVDLGYGDGSFNVYFGALEVF